MNTAIRAVFLDVALCFWVRDSLFGQRQPEDTVEVVGQLDYAAGEKKLSI